ncbi:hypothetical protein E1262_08080 [Jiangella aurantiaca]|uniref:Uncharacterized protein n=1 Tax=Jiangella aurantiaca TaxID=2530373 RepID=A0A4R5AEV1_9ACTN|nr:hypothetical protein [Jiangella aurantiaca]TDD71068.1 hypothetical protein E1262_08080 [Jiangella aurantiaca]
MVGDADGTFCTESVFFYAPVGRPPWRVTPVRSVPPDTWPAAADAGMPGTPAPTASARPHASTGVLALAGTLGSVTGMSGDRPV